MKKKLVGLKNNTFGLMFAEVAFVNLVYFKSKMALGIRDRLFM